ncbi:MAG: hypothetical protein AB7H77_06305 [Bdellovibrionales bacterium]
MKFRNILTASVAAMLFGVYAPAASAHYDKTPRASVNTSRVPITYYRDSAVMDGAQSGIVRTTNGFAITDVEPPYPEKRNNDANKAYIIGNEMFVRSHKQNVSYRGDERRHKPWTQDRREEDRNYRNTPYGNSPYDRGQRDKDEGYYGRDMTPY